MEAWESKKIKELIKEHRASELKKFMIAYGELDDKYHGYLSTFDSAQKLWFNKMTKDDLKELKKTDDGLYLHKTSSELYIKLQVPYLSYDGVLAMANDAHSFGGKSYKLDIETTLVSNTHIKAIVTSELHGKKEAIIKVDGDLEKAASSAIRSALNLMGYGRFPLKSTIFKEDPLITEFKKFRKGKDDKA